MKRILLFSTLICFSSFASAEIYKTAVPDSRCGEICFYWWPVLPSVQGWEQDLPSSYNYSANAQAPSGQTFANAESVIYAKALYKPRLPEIKSLQELIANDHDDFKKSSGAIISELTPLKTNDEQKLISFKFFPAEKGNYERVSYGEEGDFYLIFTLSSRSEKGYKSSMQAYKQFIEQYREKP